MKVELISYTQNPEKVIASAGKLCYSNSDIDTLMSNLTEESINKFINLLTDLGHESPIEHVSFTFGIEGISRSLLAQITRHRIASFSVQSQRYVKVKNIEYITPPAIKCDDKLNDLYDETIKNLVGVYQYLADELQAKYVADGMDIKSAEKKAIEDARFVLPNAAATKLIMTMNIRSLLHFFEERCCNRAQWEIRAVADEMLRQCKEISPLLFKKAGASCMYGNCKESKFCCGNPRSKEEI